VVYRVYLQVSEGDQDRSLQVPRVRVGDHYGHHLGEDLIAGPRAVLLGRCDVLKGVVQPNLQVLVAHEGSEREACGETDRMSVA